MSVNGVAGGLQSAFDIANFLFDNRRAVVVDFSS